MPRACEATVLRAGRHRKNARELKKGKPISPIALEALRRLDALFVIEREINGLTAAERLSVRQQKSKPLFDAMHEWMTTERATLSRSSEVREPIDCMLKCWADFARFLDDGRICLTNNAAERALRCIALGRRNWTFARSQRGADRAAVMVTLLTTARLNDVDPQAWLADVLARIADLLPRACTSCFLGNGKGYARSKKTLISGPSQPERLNWLATIITQTVYARA